MSAVDKFIEHVKNEVIEDPEKGWNMMLLGYKANKVRTKILPKKNLSKGYQKLESLMMSLIADTLGKENAYVWSNIFAPCEILQSFGLRALSIEALSCYFSGYRLEDYFIDCAHNSGIAPTLCSYHKTFIGAMESNAVRVPKYAVTTSLSCDGNINTFRYLDKKAGVPFTVLDIPYNNDDESVNYLVEQLKQLVIEIEKTFQKKFDIEKLKEALAIENETQMYIKEFLKLETQYLYPGELMCQLYLIMGSHLMMGTKEFRDVVKYMIEDIKTYPRFEGKRILWVHLLPFYQETLKSYFEGNEAYQMIVSDMIMDYHDTLDTDKPFEALANKIIQNVFNGSYERKMDMVIKMTQELEADGVIHFCQWGCKQVSGGSVILKDRLKELGIPMLILDGDGVDQRNNQDGQIKTRLEAFFELLEEK